MATHLDHHLDYVDEVNKRIIRHEHSTARSLLPFALAVILAAVMWLMFVRYI